MKRLYEVLFISTLFLIICFVYKGQPRISLNDGQGWDGAYYFKISEQILKGANPVVGELPFINRPGTPFLVAHYSRISGTNLLDSALVVNLAGIYLTVILLLFWLRIFINKFWLRGLLCFLFMMAWHVPLRMSFYDPMATDAWGAVWFMAGILLLSAIRKRYNLNKNKAFAGYILVFSFVVAVGSLFRESNAVLSLALFFVLNPLRGFKNLSVKSMTFSNLRNSFRKIWKLYYSRQTVFLFIPLIFVVLANRILSDFILVEERDYSYLKYAFRWFYTKSLPEYLLGIFNACGPLILLLPFFLKEIKVLLWERQELFLLIIIAFLFGFVGGSDTERIFFMSGFPVILIWMGFSIKCIFESAQRWWFFVLLALHTLAFRFYWTLPDFPSDIRHIPVPFFSLLGNHFQYLFLYSHHGQHILNSILFTEYIVLFIITWFIIQKRIKSPLRKAGEPRKP